MSLKGDMIKKYIDTELGKTVIEFIGDCNVGGWGPCSFTFFREIKTCVSPAS